MATKLLLCVSNDQTTAAVWRRRRLSSVTRFGNNEAGWAAFASFLHGLHGLPVHIIVDSVEEDFRFETLPHIRGGDRREMVGRKLKQLYRATPYYSYSLLERESGKRRDDRYLFAALTTPDLLVPWLRAIEFSRLPVSGIYPLALVSVSLIERLKLKNPNLLIISKNSPGLRQTFFKNLKFRISRLTPLLAGAELADQHYADEIGNTRMYLDALNVTHVDDMLEVVILDQDGSLSGLPATITRGRPNMQCQYLDSQAIHARFGIPVAELETSNDVLHLHLLGEQPPALNLAPPYLTRSYQTFATGRWIYAASGAALLGALVWSGFNIFSAMDLESKAVAAQTQTLEYQKKYQQVVAQFPDAPTSPGNLRQTVEAAEQIGASLRTPEKMFAIVSHALDASPSIRLRRIEWHYGDAFSAKPPEALAQVLGKEPSQFVQVGIVHADLSDFGGDYRTAMGQIGKFAQMIAQDGAVAEVKALKLPIDIRSEAGIKGNTAAIQGKDDGQFELAVIFKNGA